MIATLKRRSLSTIVIVGVFVFWEVACLTFDISDIVLPRPSQIAVELWNRWPLIAPHVLQTLYTTLIGFALGVAIGVAFGVMIGSSRLAYETAYPLLIGFNAIPKVAIVPILVLWFGMGTTPAILSSMSIAMFPVVVNIATGLATTEPELEDVLRALKATKLDILWNVGLPRTAPYFFASLKVAVTLSFVGTVLAETVAANKGIGNMMIVASSSFNVPLVFAGLIVLAIMGIALHVLFSLIEIRLTGWANRRSEILAN
ncbi:ABC transporter permease [Bradyrhizobium prioriisuperbiae]|uniref:ABC transporter permease n=1 Tax=Bradyrhizobium prioriisuperbiae TaxID=2854389 RepID=UPI0028E59E15|nr:ABC transporter permease [Bradyrhizobium prioritasuperba]